MTESSRRGRSTRVIDQGWPAAGQGRAPRGKLTIVDAPDPNDRQAYLEDQIARQKRGEPIDVEWVKGELERIRLQQAKTLARTQRNLRWLVIAAAVVLAVLWVKNGGLRQGGGVYTLGLILIAVLTVWGLSRHRRP
jgi:Flp pilus assembly protein TadB